MAKTFQQVQKQIAQLQREADQLRKKEAAGVLSRIKEAIAVYGFTAEELGLEGGRPRAVGAKKAARKSTRPRAKTAGTPKFKDDQGNVWGGRGPRPAWFRAALEAGKIPEELLA